MIAGFDLDRLAWPRQGGLLPAVVQDAATLRVLMLGYMDRPALEATLAEGRVSFYSRSRQAPWRKGDTSGHWLEVVAVDCDCDADTLLVQARPHGPTCHIGRCSCFPGAPAHALATLDAMVASRMAAPGTGYTDRLLAGGIARMAQKVGEEGVETALALVGNDHAAIRGEAADLLYHLAVALRGAGSSIHEALAELDARAGAPRA